MAEVIVTIPDGLGDLLTIKYSQKLQKLVTGLSELLMASPDEYWGYGVCIECTELIHHSNAFKRAFIEVFDQQGISVHYSEGSYAYCAKFIARGKKV